LIEKKNKKVLKHPLFEVIPELMRDSSKIVLDFLKKAHSGARSQSL